MSDPMQQKLSDVVAPYGDQAYFEKRQAKVREGQKAASARREWCYKNNVKPMDDIELLRLEVVAQRDALTLYDLQSERVVHARLRADRSRYYRNLCRQNGEAGARIAELRATVAARDEALMRAGRDNLRLGGMVDRVRALHRPITEPKSYHFHVDDRFELFTYCKHCGVGTDWPCPTVQALDGATTPRRVETAAQTPQEWGVEFDRRATLDLKHFSFPSGLATEDGEHLRDGWDGLPEWWRNDLLHAALAGAAVAETMHVEESWPDAMSDGPADGEGQP